MAVSPLQRAKRAFVLILQSLAAVYSLRLDISRDSGDHAVTSAFRRTHGCKDKFAYLHTVAGANVSVNVLLSRERDAA